MAHKYFDPVRADVEKELEERRQRVNRCLHGLRVDGGYESTRE